MSGSSTLVDTLDAVREEADGDTVPLGDILDRIEERGYGPLVMVLSAFVILPTGMIPGVPAIIGICLILLGGQMLLGKDRPWFPSRIEKFDVDCDKLRKSVDTARPWADRLSALLRQRLSALTNGPVANRVAALFIVMAGLIMVPLGFIPTLPAVLGLSMLLLGLGITARDGLVVLGAYAIYILACYLGYANM